MDRGYVAELQRPFRMRGFDLKDGNCHGTQTLKSQSRAYVDSFNERGSNAAYENRCRHAWKGFTIHSPITAS